jgi:hypothetical protein
MIKATELLEVLSDPTYKASYANAKATGTCIKCKNYANAKATGTCIKCKKPAKAYRDSSAKLEYEVSGLCQNCQDYFFNKKETARKIS